MASAFFCLVPIYGSTPYGVFGGECKLAFMNFHVLKGCVCVCLCVWLQCVTVPVLFEKLHCTVIISAVDISKLHCIIDIQQWNNLWHLIEYRKILNPLFMYMFLSVIVWKLVLTLIKQLEILFMSLTNTGVIFISYSHPIPWKAKSIFYILNICLP